MIIDELWSVRHQVAQKRGMVHEILVALSQKKILAGLSVGVLNIGYKQHISELYEHFGAIELSRITLLIVPSIKTKAC